jgi:drug/metabolite transporter (DMT)-like permease
LALVSAVAFGGSGIAAKPLIEAGLDPLHVVWLRATGAALILLPVAWRHRYLLRSRPALLAGFGLLSVAGVQAFYFASIARIPVGVALLIEYLGPVLVLGWIRVVQRRRVSRAAAAGVVVAVAGLASVVEIWSGLQFDVVGVLLALGAAACQASYFILADHGNHSPETATNPFGLIAHGLLLGAVVLTVIATPWQMEWSVLAGRADLGSASVPAVVLLAWVVVVATVVAYTTGILAVRRLSPPIAGAVAYLEVVVATIFAWILLSERLSGWQIVGGIIVLSGAFIAQTAAPRTAVPDVAVERPAEPIVAGREQ